MLVWAFNGVGLALIIPNTQSLVADYYTATQRGEAFGKLYLTGAQGHSTTGKGGGGCACAACVISWLSGPRPPPSASL